MPFRSLSEIIGATSSFALVAGMAVVAAMPAQAASGTTYTVDRVSLCRNAQTPAGGTTFEEALAKANSNPGKDTIEFAPGLGAVDVSTCYRSGMRFVFAGDATQSVDIVGNGVQMEGRQEFRLWLETNPTDRCPRNYSQAQWIRHSTGFLQVGTYGADNSDVAVSISDMRFHNLPSLVRVEHNASLAMNGIVADEINDFNDTCDEPAVATDSTGANITLAAVWITNSHTPGSAKSEFSGGALVYGGSPGSGSRGNLVFDEVYLAGNEQGRAINWYGGSTTIVSSQLVDTGGMILEADNTQIVNSAFWATGLHRYAIQPQGQMNRILSSSGSIDVKASTFYWTYPTCEYCSTSGMGFFALGPARFNFSSSAVGANASLAGGGPVLFGNTAAFTSDALTWVQPTPSQDASALRSILPLVITHPPGLKPDSWNQGPYLSAVTPLLGAPTGPGVLIDAVPDASGVNKLINPIDGSTITTDVLGNARVDANGKRNIGAVQLTYAPELSVGDPTKSTLTARWTRPLDPPSGPITGYRLSYRVKGSGAPFTSVALSGADTLQTVVTGLIPDTDYEFVVVAVNASGDGPPSATVTGRTSPDPHLDYADGKGRVGTKFDPLDPHTRDVSAPRIYTSFDGDLPPGLKLSRDTGEIAGTPTKAGKYVFQVAVTGGNNAQATTTVTITISEKPAPADPHLDYPEGKGRVSKKFDPLDPQTRDVPAPRTYTVSDRDLPPGLKLSRDTGEIAGTPTKAGKYVFKVAVTGGNNARATATVTITISDPDYPTLSYPAGEGEQGTKLVPLDPHVSGLTGQLKFAIVDGRLPDGVTMDEDTGEITGTPREHGAFTIKVKVTGREGSATTTTTVEIRASATPYLYYRTINGTVGKRVKNAHPHPGGLTRVVTYALTSGVLPAGLKLSESTGVISGTPKKVGKSQVTVTATGSNGSASATVPIVITQAGSALQVTARPEGKDLPVNRSTKVVSKVKATGKVVVKTACQVNGVRVGRHCNTVVGTKDAVTVTPTCNDRVTYSVLITAKTKGAPRQSWSRTWDVSKRPFTSCRSGGTG